MKTNTLKKMIGALRRSRWSPPLVFLLTLLIMAGAGYVLSSTSISPQEREITVRARKYAYEPEIISVNRGDTVRLRFVSEDVPHGFYLEGYDFNVSIFPMQKVVEFEKPYGSGDVQEVEEIVFVADKEGKFRYRCSRTCGFMHPFMLGEFVVGPNRLLAVGVGLTLGILLGGLAAVWLKGESDYDAPV